MVVAMLVGVVQGLLVKGEPRVEVRGACQVSVEGQLAEKEQPGNNPEHAGAPLRGGLPDLRASGAAPSRPCGYRSSHGSQTV